MVIILSCVRLHGKLIIKKVNKTKKHIAILKINTHELACSDHYMLVWFRIVTVPPF